MDKKESRLLKLANRARARAYAPYSRYQVGCVIIDEKGKLHSGCNVETVNFSGTICAERTAIVKMISRGSRAIKKVWVVTDSNPPASPCGNCLQMLAEFGPECEVITSDPKGKKIKRYFLKELLPQMFLPSVLLNHDKTK